LVAMTALPAAWRRFRIERKVPPAAGAEESIDETQLTLDHECHDVMGEALGIRPKV
jgi:hypothetical protein